MTTHLMMVTYNRLELTKQTIDNIYENTNDFKLIIVDNGSKDNTLQYLLDLQKNKYFGNIHLIINKDNKGIAYGRNQALKFASECNCEFYSTIDNDVLLYKNWLDDCINILFKNKDYAMIGVNFEDTKYPLITKNEVTFQHKEKGNLGTACMVFNKSLHKMLGFFNSYGILYGLEDSDWSMRARVLGLKLGYLEKPGIHIGSGENDIGPYREFKTKTHDSKVPQFQRYCHEYWNRTRPLYIDFKE